MPHGLKTLRQFLDERLQPPYLRLAGLAALAVGLVLLVVSFATSDRGRTAFGPPVGPDFAGFFAAAQILEQDKAAQLYDRSLHDELYHTLLPNLDKSQSIPYVHPPFLAAALRPLTGLPYEAAVAVWLGLSAALFLGGLVLAWRACPTLPRQHGGLALLLAVTFEPFLLECWMGGQLSSLGFFSMALALAARASGRPFAAGLALGLCCYKPTFLLLFVPLLIVGQAWRTLLGLTVTAAGLAVLSLWVVGWDVCLHYAEVLLAFRKSTEGADGLMIRTWKYVDLNSSLRLLLGGPSPFQLGVFLALAVVPLMALAWTWFAGAANQWRSVWAATLVWTPILNVYVGVYDSIIVLLGIMLYAEEWCRSRPGQPVFRDDTLAYLLLLVAGTAWFTQPLARATGVQIYSLAVAALGVRLLLACVTNRNKAAQSGSVPDDTGVGGWQFFPARL